MAVIHLEVLEVVEVNLVVLVVQVEVYLEAKTRPLKQVLIRPIQTTLILRTITKTLIIRTVPNKLLIRAPAIRAFFLTAMKVKNPISLFPRSRHLRKN